MITAGSSYAQDPALAYSHCETDSAYIIVEQMPQFPGGAAQLFKFLGRSAKYPSNAIVEDPQSTIIISFTVQKDGTTCGVEVKNTKLEPWRTELIQMIKNMPMWEPGKQRGKPVAVRLHLPMKINWR